jgi:hypothetical protein
MNAAQTLKLYEITFKHFKNEADARNFVQQVEEVIENKISDKKDIFLTKDDKVDLADRINKAKLETILWILGVWIAQMAAIVGLYLRK